MFALFLLLIGPATSFASPVLLKERALGSRVLNGREGDVAEVPWQVSLQQDGIHICGGSIISDFWVVSGAHCVRGSTDRYTLRVGSSFPYSGGFLHVIEKIINHPLYGVLTVFAYDINLVKVVEPFKFSALVQPIVLATESTNVAPGTLATISGFGALWWLGPATDVLQIAEIPLVSHEQCRINYNPLPITDDMICAGFSEGGIGSCSGDSGGPLVVDQVLLGVVAFGTECGAVPDRPGVYADVAYFRDWIREHSGI